MKATVFRVNRVLFSLVALLSVMATPLEGFLGPRTLILPRSQSVNAARDLVGWQQEIHRYGQTTNYWVLAFTPEYTHTFSSKHLIDQLFGEECFSITGSAVADRRSSDLLADYFELPRDYQGRLSVSPRISQFIGDFSFFVGLDRICRGLFFLIHFPVVNSKWDIRLEECTTVAGTAMHPAGYFSNTAIPRKNLFWNMREYLRGNRVIGDVQEPLLYQKVIGLSGRNVENRISDVQAAVGYDFARGENYHCGIEIRTSAPSGNRPSTKYLFDVVIGNGHHWELGGGFTSHCGIWENEINAVLVYLDANVTHLFNIESKRSFNLTGRCQGSRFMMLEEIAQGSDGLFVYGDYPSPDQYTQRLMPVINLTTLDVRTSFAVQGDVALKFAFCHKDFCLDIGYNFWGRSAEKIGCIPSFEQNRYALKGDAQIYGFDSYNPYATPIPLSVSQNEATIFAGQGAGNFVYGMEFANANADNPMPAFGPDGILVQLNSADSIALDIMQEPVATSQLPIFLSCNDLDICSALVPTSLTSKVFVHAGNTWYSKTCNPFIGLGGEAEWAHGSHNRGGISQWGIWCKMGLSY
jgi:hypothetical protein